MIPEHYLLCILGMGLATFLPRWLPLMWLSGREISPLLAMAQVRAGKHPGAWLSSHLRSGRRPLLVRPEFRCPAHPPRPVTRSLGEPVVGIPVLPCRNSCDAGHRPHPIGT